MSHHRAGSPFPAAIALDVPLPHRKVIHGGLAPIANQRTVLAVSLLAFVRRP